MVRTTVLAKGLAMALCALASAGAMETVFAQPATPNDTVTLARGITLHASDQAALMNANAPVRVNVVLNMHHSAELQQIADQVRLHTRSPLTDKDMAARYLPSRADAMRVYNFLRANGFGQIYVSKDNMIVTAWGSAADVQAAFKTRLYQLHRGEQTGIANADAVGIPSALSDAIAAVHGLRSFQERGVSGAKVAATARDNVSWHGKGAPGTQSTTGVVACRECVHAPTDFPSLYGAGNLAPANNQVVALIGVGDQRNTNYLYQTWASNYGFPFIPLDVIYPTGYTQGDYEAQTEAALDVDAVATMTGGLQKIAFYSAPSTNLDDELAAVTAAIDDDRPTISLSFAATCDADIGQDLRNSWDQELAAAVAKGITVFAITQDAGGYPGCSDNESSTGFPGSSPYVVSVGASTLYNTVDSYSTYDHETLWTWSESGPAATEARPSYQNAVANIVGNLRSTPDFVMDGDPNSGLWIVTGGYDSSGTYQTNWAVYGGTSLAAPLLAGTYARLLQSGIAPSFWQQTFYDIGIGQVNQTSGDCPSCYHLLTGGSNGAYSVVPGQFNQASGWGSWNAAALATGMALQR
ncbi:MAG TPA: protease pro-enzyme activation domain-containing protein [Dyella sp.]|uniref:S53 family peptidase n=1 Tax=Dyella sp. TaxID=1869338 RepID=UPI002BD5EEF4|nr:protease pro-enzyme activation domain-containing protein [Dyella sp.]HUB90501.1 protease pro-enzyme activation domain-containing protein [Dyella sp.]